MDFTNITADRGKIYEFLDKFGNAEGRALVISNQRRSRDNVVSILKLSPVGNGNDAVAVDYDSKTGNYWYVHCGCVSYAYRNRLGKQTGEATEGAMDAVDKTVKEELGLDEGVSYKKLYEDLISQLTKQTGMVYAEGAFYRQDEDKMGWTGV